MTEFEKYHRYVAAHGTAEEQCELAAYYFGGEGPIEGVYRDREKGAMWFRKSAERGYAPAQYSFALCNLSGMGVERNNSEAVRWCRRTGTHGSAVCFCPSSLQANQLQKVEVIESEIYIGEKFNLKTGRRKYCYG